MVTARFIVLTAVLGGFAAPPGVGVSQKIEWGAIAEGDIDLLHWAETPTEAFTRLQAHLLEHHLEPRIDQEAAAPGIAKTRS